MLDASLTYERFMDIHNDEKLWQLLSTRPSNYAELIGRYLPSKLWRLNNLYKIIDKAGDPVDFVMNIAQHKVYAASVVHARVIILKSRQQGISTFWLISFLDDAMFYSNYNCGLMAQGKDEAGTLLERLKFAWDNIPPFVKTFLKIKVYKDNSQEFSLTNNSAIFVRTSFRSATLQRLHISELGKIANKYPERAKEVKTGTLQALAPGNTGAIESTAEGHNAFKTMWDSAVRQSAAGRLAPKDFMPVFLSWLDDPDCVEFVDQIPDDEALVYFKTLEEELGITLRSEQKNFWIAQYRELEGDIHQEYPATPDEAFRAAMDGTFWAKRYIECVIRRRQRLPNLYDQNLDVYVALDVGKHDYFVMIYFQIWRGQIRIVDEYYNNNEWLGHYVNHSKDLVKEKGYRLSTWYLPHDMAVEDVSQPELKSRKQVLEDLGVTRNQLLEKIDKRESIEHVRASMSLVWIDEECVYIEQCMLNYTKEWSTITELWKDEPKRNQFAHGADAVRYMIQACYMYHNIELPDEERALSIVNNNYGGVSI